MARFEAIPMDPFGATVTADLSAPLSEADATEFRDLFYRHKLLVFRGVELTEDMQAGLGEALGPILAREKDVRELSSDGNFGSGGLLFHSDLSFTPEPFKAISLYGMALNPGQSSTRYANGVEAYRRLSPQLRARVEGLQAVSQLAILQDRRDPDIRVHDFLPHHRHDVVTRHPVTGEAILYVTQQQTIMLEEPGSADGDGLLEELFAVLYAPDHVYEHRWHEADLVCWDNLALQHARPDLTGMIPRKLRRIVTADKGFGELTNNFRGDDPRIQSLAGAEQYGKLSVKADT